MIKKLTLGLVAAALCIGRAVFNGSDVVRLSNIGEGDHASGQITKLTDAAISGRYRVVKLGSDSGHIAVTAANTDLPFGICSDEASGAEMPLNVKVLGNIGGTTKVLLGGTVAAGAEIIGGAGGAAIALPVAAGTYYPIGRAMQAGVSGDTIEVSTQAPVARVVS